MSMTVSNVDPQVAMVAVPDVAGVHWNVRSRDAKLLHVFSTDVPPTVSPLKTPPPAGMTVANGHRAVAPQSSTQVVPPTHTICSPVVVLPGQSASVVHAWAIDPAPGSPQY